MKLLVGIFFSFFTTVAFAETSPQATPFIDRAKQLAIEHKFDKAIEIVEATDRHNNEDEAVLGCLIWAVNKLRLIELGSRITVSKGTIEQNVNDICTAAKASRAIYDAVETAKMVDTDEKLKQSMNDSRAIKGAVIGVLNGGNRACRVYSGVSELCPKIYQVLYRIDDDIDEEALKLLMQSK